MMNAIHVHKQPYVVKDKIEEINQTNKLSDDPRCLLKIKKNEKFSRNERCPVTDKKYKNCCGAL